MPKINEVYAVREVEIYCPTCDRLTSHEIIKIRGKKVKEGIARCKVCGTVHDFRFEDTKPKEVSIKTIISDVDRSWTENLKFERDRVFRVGEDFWVRDKNIRLKITAIDCKDGQRRRAAKAEDIDTLWAIRYDRIRVKFSVHRGSITSSHFVWMAPEEYVEIGDVYRFGNLYGVVTKIKTEDGVVDRGRVQAKDIVRVYCRAIKRRIGRALEEEGETYQ